MKKKTKLKSEVVLVVRAPDTGYTIGEWDKYLRSLGLQLEEVMTPGAWERRNNPLRPKENPKP